MEAAASSHLSAGFYVLWGQAALCLFTRQRREVAACPLPCPCLLPAHVGWSIVQFRTPNPLLETLGRVGAPKKDLLTTSHPLAQDG